MFCTEEIAVEGDDAAIVWFSDYAGRTVGTDIGRGACEGSVGSIKELAVGVESKWFLSLERRHVGERRHFC